MLSFSGSGRATSRAPIAGGLPAATGAPKERMLVPEDSGAGPGPRVRTLPRMAEPGVSAAFAIRAKPATAEDGTQALASPYCNRKTPLIRQPSGLATIS